MDYPVMAEARDRLQHFLGNGATPFSFTEPFPKPE